MRWGNEVHKALEDAVSGVAPLSMRFMHYSELVQQLKAQPGQKTTEQKFGLTQTLAPTTFSAPDVWVRGVVDLMVNNGDKLAVLDYKTGAVKNDGAQLKLFAAAGFALNPHVQTVRTGYLWLAHDKLSRQDFKREDAAGIWNEFLPRVNRMQEAQAQDKWPARPSGLCRAWCPVGKKHCDHCGG